MKGGIISAPTIHFREMILFFDFLKNIFSSGFRQFSSVFVSFRQFSLVFVSFRQFYKVGFQCENGLIRYCDWVGMYFG